VKELREGRQIQSRTVVRKIARESVCVSERLREGRPFTDRDKPPLEKTTTWDGWCFLGSDLIDHLLLCKDTILVTSGSTQT
jgi:hypothetical protein